MDGDGLPADGPADVLPKNGLGDTVDVDGDAVPADGLGDPVDGLLLMISTCNNSGSHFLSGTAL